MTLTATDDAGLTDEATFTIDVNRAPVASAGPDQPAVECGGDKAGCAEVTLDGSGSSDPDGDVLTFQWDGPGGPFTPGALITATLPLGGPHTFTLTVTDPDGATDSDTVDVTVVDTTAPEVTAELVPVKVSKKHGTFEVRFSCEDACDGTLDGGAATLNDIIVANGQIVRLELKKPTRPKSGGKSGSSSGDKSGRGLTIRGLSFELVVECEDAAGNVGTDTATPEFAASKPKSKSESKSKSGSRRKSKS